MGTQAMLADVAALVEGIGGRPSGSDGARAAAEHVAAALAAAGLPVARQAVKRDVNVWTCQGDPADAERVFLAHTDTVATAVPGAVDNAAGVAVLLEAARVTAADPPPRTCFAFPAAEELLFWGSREMPFRPRLAVALDLVGHGRLSVTGLGPAWGDAGIAWLAATAPDVAQPYAYRIVSRLDPSRERSDHRAFAGDGVLSLHLLGRGPSGVFWDYHTAEDRLDDVDPAALAATLDAVLALARAPLPAPDAPSPAFRAWGAVVPGWGAWALTTAGALAGAVPAAASLPSRASLVAFLAAVARTALPAVAGGVAWEVARLDRPAGAALAGPVALAAVLAFALVALALGPRDRAAALAASRWLLFASAGVALPLDPLLALPWTLAAAAVRLAGATPAAWPVGALATVPIGYLLLPASTRELAFHMLFPAGGALRAVAVALLLWPVGGWLAAAPLPSRARRPVLAGLALALAATLALAWSTAPWSDAFPARAFWLHDARALPAEARAR